MSRYDRQYLAGRWAAQEARREARAADREYAASEGATRWASAAVVDTTFMPAAAPKAAVADSARSASAAGTPSKYRNKRTDGYASKKEARRAAELRVMQVQGLIRNLREQVVFLLIPEARDAEGKLIERACTYRADFVYEEAPLWHPVIEDCKGVHTEVYRIKRKLMYMVHGIRVRET